MDDHIPDAGKMVPDRCEPPEHLRGVDGWHWVSERGVDVFIARWRAAPHNGLEPLWIHSWRGSTGTPRWAASEWEWRYIAPVATPAEVEALRAEVMRAGAECADAMSQVVALRARVAKLEAAIRAADQFVTNGIALGFIRMPSPSTPDPAHRTPGIIRAALKENADG